MAKKRQSKQNEPTTDKTTVALIIELRSGGGVIGRFELGNIQDYADTTVAALWENVLTGLEKNSHTLRRVPERIFLIPYDLGYTGEGKELSKVAGTEIRRYMTVVKVQEQVEALCRHNGGEICLSKPVLEDDGLLDVYEIQVLFESDDVAQKTEDEVMESWGMYGVTAINRPALEEEDEEDEDEDEDEEESER